MPAETQARERLEPLVLVDTTDLPRDDWLNYRRRGIGGSDVAAILGVSPFRTARDIYYDKIGVVAVEPDESNWVPLEVGNLLEDLVARIFQKKTGYRVFKIKKMFYHSKYQFMLADVDYFVELPDGTIALLEIKTTNYNAKDHWWLDGREVVPVYYELQGRHYMAVTDYDRVFFCCLYGNTEDEVIIREIRRDMAYEEEMIYLEQAFWQDNVQKKIPPPYVEDGDLVLDSVRMYSDPADTEADAVTLDKTQMSIIYPCFIPALIPCAEAFGVGILYQLLRISLNAQLNVIPTRRITQLTDRLVFYLPDTFRGYVQGSPNFASGFAFYKTPADHSLLPFLQRRKGVVQTVHTVLSHQVRRYKCGLSFQRGQQIVGVFLVFCVYSRGNDFSFFCHNASSVLCL